jgi:tripartite-type tricarboxylate transporter receptor subunit TctC
MLTFARTALRLAGLLLGLAAWLASAQQLPNRPLTIVVAFPAGGPTDVIARLLADSMSRQLGQQIVVDNIAGAGGTIGAARVARATPDGTTLMLHQVALAAAASIYQQLPYDTINDFDGVGLVNFEPMVIVGRKTLAARTLPELVAWLRATPTPAIFANSGIGTPSHLCAVLFIGGVGARATDVPYRGGPPALNDVLAGQADLFCGQSFGLVEQIRGGAVHGYVVTSRQRDSALPELPSLDEAGFKGLETVVWHGLYVPRGTPAQAVAKLNKALRQALADPALASRLSVGGSQLFEPDRRTPAAAEQMLAAEVAKWREVIRDNHITAQ